MSNKKYNNPVRLSISLDEENYRFLQRRAQAERRSVVETLNLVVFEARKKIGAGSANPLDLLPSFPPG